jgi:hypothetical protein
LRLVRSTSGTCLPTRHSSKVKWFNRF